MSQGLREETSQLRCYSFPSKCPHCLDRKDLNWKRIGNFDIILNSINYGNMFYMTLKDWEGYRSTLSFHPGVGKEGSREPNGEW